MECGVLVPIPASRKAKQYFLMVSSLVYKNVCVFLVVASFQPSLVSLRGLLTQVVYCTFSGRKAISLNNFISFMALLTIKKVELHVT